MRERKWWRWRPSRLPKTTIIVGLKDWQERGKLEDMEKRLEGLSQAKLFQEVDWVVDPLAHIVAVEMKKAGRLDPDTIIVEL